MASSDSPFQDILFEDFSQVIQRISLISPLTVASQTPASVASLKSKTLALLDSLIAPHNSSSLSTGEGNAARIPLGRALFRFLFPHLDVRRRYAFKEGSFAPVLGLVLGVGVEKGMAGEGLRRWDDASFWECDEGEVRRGCGGCMGDIVHRLVLQRGDPSRRSTLTLTQVDALLTELSSHSPFSSPHITQTLHPPSNRRPKLLLLQRLYTSLSPFAASLLTQIILQDLSPLVNPPPTPRTGTRGLLLEYNQKSRWVFEKWDLMRLWDGGTGRMGRIWKVRGVLEEAVEELEIMGRGERVDVKVGRCIEIPKCEKGRSVQYLLKKFEKSGCSTVWAETKYDGERMQVHIDLSLPPCRQIKILSKSTRDSTADRHTTHPIIAAALSLLTLLSHLHLPPYLRSRLLRSAPALTALRVQSSIIVEAEMVPYSESKHRIEDFWKITRCAGDKRRNWGRQGKKRMQDENGEDEDASSQEPNPEDLHLQLVFFDVLELDGRGLLDVSYESRREVLERLIRPIEGFSMLAHRTEIRFDKGLLVAEADLNARFTQSMKDREEGLVLKPAHAGYSSRHGWVKMKRDYIPGLDDTVDLTILGASWDKERGRELNVPPSVFTTFHVGVRVIHPGIQRPMNRPDFIILFSISYGLSRKQLEEWNFYLQSGMSPKFVSWRRRNESLGHTLQLANGVKPPMVVLKQPLLGEIFGAGFQKLRDETLYELRWPRLSKIYPERRQDGGKSWTEGLDSIAYHDLALISLGRTPPQPPIPTSTSSNHANNDAESQDSLDSDYLFPNSTLRIIRPYSSWSDNQTSSTVRQRQRDPEDAPSSSQEGSSTLEDDGGSLASCRRGNGLPRPDTERKVNRGSPSSKPTGSRPELKALRSITNIPVRKTASAPAVSLIPSSPSPTKRSRLYPPPLPISSSSSASRPSPTGGFSIFQISRPIPFLHALPTPLPSSPLPSSSPPHTLITTESAFPPTAKRTETTAFFSRLPPAPLTPLPTLIHPASTSPPASPPPSSAYPSSLSLSSLPRPKPLPQLHQTRSTTPPTSPPPHHLSFSRALPPLSLSSSSPITTLLSPQTSSLLALLSTSLILNPSFHPFPPSLLPLAFGLPQNLTAFLYQLAWVHRPSPAISPSTTALRQGVILLDLDAHGQGREDLRRLIVGLEGRREALKRCGGGEREMKRIVVLDVGCLRSRSAIRIGSREGKGREEGWERWMLWRSDA